jgi:lambda family phage tail tape measure protein
MSQVTELLVRIKEQGGEQLTRLQGTLKNLAQQTAATNINFKEASDELRKIQQNSANSINNLKGYANAWREIANSVELGSAEFKQASAEAAKLDAQLRKVQPGGRGRLAGAAQIAGTIAGAGVFGGLEGGAGAAIGGIIGGVPGSIVGGAIGAQVGQARQSLGGLADYTAQIEKQRIALRLVTADASSFAQGLVFIDQTSRQFAIPQELITRQFTQLSASVIGAGGNVKDAEKAFLGIAAGIRGTGGSLEDMDAALRATAQVFSKGKVSAEELRQQIGERLPGAFTLFAKSIGMTPQELDKALEQGQVSLQDFMKFAEELFKRYGKNAEIIAKGPQSAGDRLQAALSRLSESVGRLLAPIGAAFQSIFADIVEAIDRAARSLARFMGMKFYDPARINELKGDIARIRKEIDQLGPTGGKATAGREQLLRLKVAELTQLEGLKPKGGSTGQLPPSNLPGIIPGAGKEGRAKEDQEAKRQERLLERRIELTRKASEFQRDLNNKVFETNEKIQSLGANSIQVFERQYIDKVTDAEKITGDLLLKIFNFAKEVREAGGKLNIQNLVQTVVTLENTAKSLAQNEYVTNLNDLFKELDTTFTEITDRVYENARALQYNADVMGGLKDGLMGYSEGIGTVRQAFSDLAESGIKKIEDSIFELLTTGTVNYREFASQILKETTRMILQQYVLKGVMQALGFLKPAASSGLSPLQGIPLFQSSSVNFNPLAFSSSFAMGGIMTPYGPMQLKKYANGGIANSPQLAVFGEGARSEAYVPLPDGRSIPVTMRGGGNATVVVNVDATGSKVQGDNSDANALGRVVGAAVQQELIRQKRPGGLLA